MSVNEEYLDQLLRAVNGENTNEAEAENAE